MVSSPGPLGISFAALSYISQDLLEQSFISSVLESLDNILIGKDLVCGSFVFVLKLTNNNKIHFMKFVVLPSEFKSFHYHTVSLI